MIAPALASERERGPEARSDRMALLLHAISHDLKGPLSILGLQTRILRRELRGLGLSPRVESTLGSMTHTIRRMCLLVDDLVDGARDEGGQLRLDLRSVDLAEHVAAVLRRNEGFLNVARIETDLRRDVPPVQVDPDRFERVLLNLLTNGLKYSRGRVSLRVERRGDRAAVVVTDQGDGVSAEDLPRLFEPFFRASAHQGVEGTGLGLHIVKRLVEAQGGSVCACSEGPGRGSAFTVLLPLQGALAAAEAGERSRPSAVRQRQMRVLVVEDSADGAEMLTEVLRVAGCEVEVAPDAGRALAALDRFAADAVVLDVGLPAMDGYELAARVREARPGVRLVALTGYDRPEDLRRAVAAGFSAHLVKPVRVDALLAALGGPPGA